MHPRMDWRKAGRSIGRLARALAAGAAVWCGPVGLVGLAGPAHAQTVDKDPYYVVVSAGEATLRCGADDLYYEIAAVREGDVLLVDGEGPFGVDQPQWLRVALPDGAEALIKADEEQVEFDAQKSVLRLSRPSRLLAYSLRGDLKESWKKLLNKPLPPATELRVTNVVRDANGTVLAYRVLAPAEARGYIHERFTRRATQEEALAFVQRRDRPAAQAARPAPQPEQRAAAPAPTPADTRANAAPTNTTPTNTTPTNTAPAGRSAGDALAQAPATTPPADAGAAPTRAPTQAPAEAPPVDRVHANNGAHPIVPPITSPTSGDTSPAPAMETDSTQVAIAQPDQGEPEPAAAAPMRLPTLGELERAYAQVLKEPVTQSEVEPLISDHERYLAAMDRGEAPGDDLDRRVLVVHLDLLRIRSDLKQSMLRAEEVRQRADQGAASASERISGLDRSAEYVAVGRLTTSVVYDGQRLPLMYRVQSVDEASARTLAYVVPAPGVDLSGRLGAIVGVVGDARVDPSSRLNIIQPTRVDLLRAGGESKQ